MFQSTGLKWFFLLINFQTARFLAGGFNHLEKYESQWEGLSHIWENQKWLKPPIRFC